MADTKQSEVLKQISAAWEKAQRQLTELRRQVEQTSELAQAKIQGGFLARDLDKAYRDLGEATWGAIQRGEVLLPPSLDPAVRATQEAHQKVHAQNQEIADLLRETEVDEGTPKHPAGGPDTNSTPSDKR